MIYYQVALLAGVAIILALQVWRMYQGATPAGFPIVIKVVTPNDARGWIGLGCWVLVLVVLAMIYFERKLLDNDAFLILATAVVITGWVQGPVGWAYQATKGGGEAAESNARIAENASGLPAQPTPGAPTGTEDDPTHSVIINEPHEPVPTTTEEAKP